MKTVLFIFCVFIALAGALSAEEALFSVTNNDTTPDTVFAVYPSGIKVLGEDGELVMVANRDSVRMYIDEAAAGRSSRGGFAVGGVASRTLTKSYLTVQPDSTRIFFNELLPERGSRGGFAVGGVASRSVTRDYLSINQDSTRINVKDSDTGFSIGNMQDTGTSKFMDLTTENYSIGHNAGSSLTTGLYNTFLGYNAGVSNTTGSNNVFIGYESGQNNSAGVNNVFMGYKSGKENIGVGSFTGDYNVFIGYQSGMSNGEGQSNVFIGESTGQANDEGRYNLFLGNKAGLNNQTGNFNCYLGSQSGYHNILGVNNTYVGYLCAYNDSSSNNVFMGFRSAYNHTSGEKNFFAGGWSGYNNVDGAQNTLVGDRAGYNNVNGSGNVFLGHQAGYYESDSNKLYIENSSTTYPLIYGEFDSDMLVINGNDSHNSSDFTFYVNGTAGGNLAWNSGSDRNLKKNIETIPNALKKVMKLRGVNFEWKDKDCKEKGKRIGFIAQEVEEVIPEVINKDNDKYSMQYAPVNALLVEAIKEQQELIDAMNDKMEIMQKQIDNLSK